MNTKRKPTIKSEKYCRVFSLLSTFVQQTFSRDSFFAVVGVAFTFVSAKGMYLKWEKKHHVYIRLVVVHTLDVAKMDIQRVKQFQANIWIQDAHTNNDDDEEEDEKNTYL